MTIGFPVSGSFIDFADRFVDPAFPFAAGFSMWLGWTVVIAAEAVFFTTVVNYWAEDRVPQAALSKIDRSPLIYSGGKRIAAGTNISGP